MKILKILFAISILTSIYCIADLIFLAFFFEEMKTLLGNGFTSDDSFWFDRSIGFVNSIGVFSITLGLWNAIKTGPYEKKASTFIYIGGILFILSSLILICYDLISVIHLSNPYSFANLMTTDFMLLVLGIGTIFTADVLKKGIVLKQDNDLTI